MHVAVAAPAAAASSSSSGFSTTADSVVSTMAAIDAAFCSAERVTLAGSMMPAFTMSTHSPVAALKPSAVALGADLLDDDRALEAGVLRDAPGGLGQRVAHDLRAGRLVALQVELVERGLGADQRDAAAGDDALFDGRAGRRDGVLDAVLLLLELDLGGRADLDHGDAAGELGEPLLELLRSQSESVFSISALIWLMRPLTSSS